MMQFAQGESLKTIYGYPHLYKDGVLRVFANMTQAENAARRVGGQAYKSPLSSRFIVRVVGY